MFAVFTQQSGTRGKPVKCACGAEFINLPHTRRKNEVTPKTRYLKKQTKMCFFKINVISFPSQKRFSLITYIY